MVVGAALIIMWALRLFRAHGRRYQWALRFSSRSGRRGGPARGLRAALVWDCVAARGVHRRGGGRVRARCLPLRSLAGFAGAGVPLLPSFEETDDVVALESPTLALASPTRGPLVVARFGLALAFKADEELLVYIASGGQGKSRPSTPRASGGCAATRTASGSTSGGSRWLVPPVARMAASARRRWGPSSFASVVASVVSALDRHVAMRRERIKAWGAADAWSGFGALADAGSVLRLCAVSRGRVWELSSAACFRHAHPRAFLECRARVWYPHEWFHVLRPTSRLTLVLLVRLPDGFSGKTRSPRPSRACPSITFHRGRSECQLGVRFVRG